MHKKTKILIFMGITTVILSIAIFVSAVSVYLANTRYTQEYPAQDITINPRPNNLTKNDIFISDDFSPLHSQSEFTWLDTLLYDGMAVPNYLQFGKANRHGDIFHPYRTMLYITHRNAYGGSNYVVYGFNYGFEFSYNICLDELRNIRNMYFRHLQKLFESTTVEELELSLENALKNIFCGLRMFIDEQMHTNGVNMYLALFQISPFFDLLAYYPNNQPSSQGFIIFNIENGISQPASIVTRIDDTTIFLERDGTISRFSE